MKEKNRKIYVFGGLEKLIFTYITEKLAKSNLGNLCLQFKSAPFICMLGPTCKFYMSSKFHKLFASPISKGRPPSQKNLLVKRPPTVPLISTRACQPAGVKRTPKTGEISPLNRPSAKREAITQSGRGGPEGARGCWHDR